MAATRLDIRTKARVRADQDAARFPTDAQYNLFIDEACKDVFADLVMSGWPPDFSTTTIVYNGSSTGQAVGGGVDVFSIVGVWVDIGGTRFELKRLNEGDRARLSSGNTGGSYPEYYDYRVGTSGPVIYFFPRKAATVSVDFIPDHTGLASDGAIWRGPSRSDELLVLAAARKGVLKEGSARAQDAAQLKGEYDELHDKIRQQAGWADMRNPAMIRDNTGRRGRYNDFDFDAVGPNGDF